MSIKSKNTQKFNRQPKFQLTSKKPDRGLNELLSNNPYDDEDSLMISRLRNNANKLYGREGSGDKTPDLMDIQSMNQKSSANR